MRFSTTTPAARASQFAHSGASTYVGYLRRKLGLDRINTVRGMGYALSDGSA